MGLVTRTLLHAVRVAGPFARRARLNSQLKTGPGGRVRESQPSSGGCLSVMSCQRPSYCTAANSSETKVKVLYDGSCPLCRKEINMLRRVNEKKQQLAFVDISLPDYRPESNGGVTVDDAMKEMTVLGKDGQVHRRIQAFQVMYGAVGFGWVWAITKVPGIDTLAEKAYMWFARNRHRLSPGQTTDCDSGTCDSKPKDSGSNKS